MRFVWAQYAPDDRDTIYSHIESENPKAAIHVHDEIVRATRRLLDFPESGRPGRIAGTRTVIPRTLAYVVMADRFRILRALHGAQMRPDELDDK